MKQGRLFAIILTLLAPQVRASDVDYVHLLRGERHFDPATAIDDYRDPTGQVTISEAPALPYTRLGRTPDFGFTADKFWLRFGVVNDDSDNTQWVLRTYVRFMRPLEIYISRNGETPRQILFNDEHSTFGIRPEKIRHLAVEFALARGQRAVFYLRFGAGGAATLPMEITTPEEIVVEQSRALLTDAVFVAVLMTLVLFNLFHYFAVRARAYLLYGIQATAIALYVTHMDGFTFQYLWPNLPRWNSVASPLLGSSVHFSALLFSMSFLRSKEYTPRYYRWLVVLLTASGATMAASLVISPRLTNQIGLVMIFIIGLSLLPHAAYVVRQGNIAARYYLLGWTFMLVGVCLFGARMLGAFGEFGVSSLNIMKVSILLESLSLALGLADQHRRLHIEHASTQQRLVESLEQRLGEARERIQLEREREETVRSLLQQSQHLAETSHDINQPIHSLRLALNALSSRIDDPVTVATLDRTLAHMGDVLSTALSGVGEQMRDHAAISSTIVTGELLGEIVGAFSQEAQATGHSIRHFDSQLVFSGSRLPLKRCLMNLAANALKHSRGDVLLGAKCRESDIVIEVIDDGIGMTDEQTVLLLSAWHSGNNSPGYGLGLAIVQGICKEYGWGFSLASRVGRGTRASITVPRSPPDG